MHFLVTARDYAGGLEKRLSLRPAHIELGDRMHKEDKLLFGGAVLDDKGNMTGSVLVCNFPDRQSLDEWLAVEPYVTGKVWKTISIEPFVIGPSFLDALAAKA
jgi:uncharacterized protein YciI